jgi:hypothetical protein
MNNRNHYNSSIIYCFSDLFVSTRNSKQRNLQLAGSFHHIIVLDFLLVWFVPFSFFRFIDCSFLAIFGKRNFAYWLPLPIIFLIVKMYRRYFLGSHFSNGRDQFLDHHFVSNGGRKAELPGLISSRGRCMALESRWLLGWDLPPITPIMGGWLRVMQDVRPAGIWSLGHHWERLLQ